MMERMSELNTEVEGKFAGVFELITIYYSYSLGTYDMFT